MFPTLFLYGVGGFEDESRKYNIPFKGHIKHLLKLNDRRFQQHHSFCFIAFNILQRQTVLLHSYLRMKHSSFALIALSYAMITPQTIKTMIDCTSRGDFNTAYNDDERSDARRPCYKLSRRRIF